MVPRGRSRRRRGTSSAPQRLPSCDRGGDGQHRHTCPPIRACCPRPSGCSVLVGWSCMSTSTHASAVASSTGATPAPWWSYRGTSGHLDQPRRTGRSRGYPLAAARLGVTRQTLYRHVSAHGGSGPAEHGSSRGGRRLSAGRTSRPSDARSFDTWTAGADGSPHVLQITVIIRTSRSWGRVAGPAPAPPGGPLPAPAATK